MRYPVVPQTNVAQVVQELLDDGLVDVETHVEWTGQGTELDLTGIEDTARALVEDYEAHLAGPNAKDLDMFEGIVGARLHAALGDAGVLVEVLDEPGFWAYLTVRHLWWFVHTRQESTFEKKDYGEFRKYVDGTNPTECVLLRAYLRARISRRDDDHPYKLASAIPNGTDFWRSHVLRVQTSMSPTLTQAFAAEQVQDRMNTDELRGYARRLNRMWSNVVMHVYDADEAAEVISELR